MTLPIGLLSRQSESLEMKMLHSPLSIGPLFALTPSDSTAVAYREYSVEPNLPQFSRRLRIR